jgi:tetratricopeptide (TPR) repeat protein
VRWALLLPLLLADCGGGSAPDTGAPPTDEMLQRQTHAGQLAFELERNEEAAAQYRTALSRAQARDDPDAIGDTGYNLAVAELRANAPEKALADARETRIELERRGSKAFPALLLAEATALYRTGVAAEADRAAQRVQQSEDADAVARATFLRGLIADDRGDEAGLATAADDLTTAKTPPFEADSAELSARLALRRGDPARAREQAARAAGLRQATLDYRGLARALAIEGAAVERAGDKIAAADLFLRAARSAAAQGDTSSARDWLRRAMSLAPGRTAGRDAADLLHRIDKSDH